jgi:hypothetical protein
MQSYSRQQGHNTTLSSCGQMVDTGVISKTVNQANRSGINH